MSDPGEDLVSVIAHLAIARGTRADREELTVYAEDLEDLPLFIVASVCRDLRKRPKGEYESALPPVHVIRREVQRRMRPDPGVHIEPDPAPEMTPEQFARGCAMRDKFLTDLKTLIRQKRMPKPLKLPEE